MNNLHLDFSSILASSVHDMKNSLTMLLGALDDITHQCSPTNCQSAKDLQLLQHEGRRVNRHLIHLLALYRIDKQQYCLNISEVPLDELIEEFVMENDEALNARDIQLVTDHESDLVGYFDKELVAGAINTIINNAYQYTKSIIQIRAYKEDGYLVLSVEDNGEGYPESMLNVDNNQQKGINYVTGGTGLGIYFAGRVAELHENNGSTGFTKISNTGIDGGGCFSIYLP
jgi:signal transduction histidine kinase